MPLAAETPDIDTMTCVISAVDCTLHLCHCLPKISQKTLTKLSLEPCFIRHLYHHPVMFIIHHDFITSFVLILTVLSWREEDGKTGMKFLFYRDRLLFTDRLMQYITDSLGKCFYIQGILYKQYSNYIWTLFLFTASSFWSKAKKTSHICGDEKDLWEMSSLWIWYSADGVQLCIGLNIGQYFILENMFEKVKVKIKYSFWMKRVTPTPCIMVCL